MTVYEQLSDHIARLTKKEEEYLKLSEEYLDKAQSLGKMIDCSLAQLREITIEEASEII